MSRSEVRKMLIEIVKMKTKRTDNDKYVQELSNVMFDYSLSSADLSQKAVQNYLKSKTFALSESDINNSLELVEKIYKSGLTNEHKLFIQEKVTGFYTARREKPKNDKTKFVKKAELSGIDLDMTNSQVGNIIGYGQVTWIKDYWTNNETSKTLSSLFKTALEKKLTGAETAALLKINLGKEAPKDWVKKFGEDRYWRGVADQHISKARTIADIHNYRDAGFEYLRIYARMTERTCEECGRKHRTLVKVSDSVKIVDSYLSAAMTGNIDLMKKAMPWGSSADLPTFHFLCQCYTEPVIPGEFVIEEELDRISESDLEYIDKIKAYENALKTHTNMKHESAAFVDGAGKITGFRDGGRDRVMLDRKSIETIKKGSKIIHVHPDGGSLSVTDALVSLKFKTVISAVTTEYTYEMYAKGIDTKTLQTRYFQLEKSGLDSHEIWTKLSKEYEGFYYARN